MSLQKRKKRTNLSRIFDNALIILLIIVVVSAWVDGKLIRKEVHLIETCNGEVVDPSLTMDVELKEHINKQLRPYQKRDYQDAFNWSVG